MNFNKIIKIGKNYIGPKHKTMFIAEIGSNFDGNLKKAKDLSNKNIEGIIVGKAIYDGDIKLEELVKELDA